MACAQNGSKSLAKKRPPGRRTGAAAASSGASSTTAVGVALTPAAHGWTFLSNHAHVLLCLAEDPATRLRDVAVRVGITERAVQKIVADLEAAAVLTRTRDGRRNHYAIDADRPLRHPIEQHRTVAALLDLLRR